MESQEKNRRILVIDDTVSIHADIRTVLNSKDDDTDLTDMAALIFSEEEKRSAKAPPISIDYQIDSAYQGQEGLKMVVDALERDEPYALAIVDMRMPPGWDGLKTIEKIREVDSHLQIAICTAYTDYSWEEMLEKFGHNDWLLIFKKPFDFAEVRQLACAVTEKWNLARQAAYKMDDLQRMIEQHAADLHAANEEMKVQNHRLSEEITARKLADERIRHLAYHDTLTDLPNRMLLMERLDSCVEKSKRNKGYQFAVLFMDLDDFKIVNDSLGHRVGDRLLRQIAQDVSTVIRSTNRAPEPSLDTVARLGGDEFIVVLDDVQDAERAVQIAERIIKMVNRTVTIEQKEIVPSLSVGVALSEGGYDDPADLVRDADTALYHAKDEGKGRVEVFDKAMRVRVTQRMDLENDLRNAIAEQQLFISYQPIVSLATGEIESFEALTRWHHPTRGLVPPSEFIPIAEESGLIIPLGSWIFEEVCGQLYRWRTLFPRANDLSISVNLSVRQLRRPEIVDEVIRVVEMHDLDPSAIKLEITESMIMDDSHVVQKVVEDFKSRNFDFHLDDFGTGFSSLSVLHKLPVAAIKLDQSFIRELPEQLEFAATVQAMVMLSRNRGIQLIAEGVETVEQLIQLQTLDCDLAQGFYFSRPVSPTEIESMLSSNKSFACCSV